MERDYSSYNLDTEYQLLLNNLQMICEKKNLSKYALAKATGMSTSSISNLMNGKTKPYIYTILLICNVLEIQISELLYKKDDMQKINEDKIIDVYRCMTDEKRKMLEIYMDMLLKYDGKL